MVVKIFDHAFIAAYPGDIFKKRMTKDTRRVRMDIYNSMGNKLRMTKDEGGTAMLASEQGTVTKDNLWEIITSHQGEDFIPRKSSRSLTALRAANFLPKGRRSPLRGRRLNRHTKRFRKTANTGLWDQRR